MLQPMSPPKNGPALVDALSTNKKETRPTSAASGSNSMSNINRMRHSYQLGLQTATNNPLLVSESHFSVPLG